MNSPLLESGRSPGPRRMAVALIVMVLLVALVLGIVFGWQAFAGSFFKKFKAQAAAAPQTVSTVTAAKAPWQAQVRAIGSLRAVRGADLSAQAAGVAIDAGAATSEITLPQTAITYNPYGNTVFVVEHATGGGQSRDTVQQRFVKLGETRGDQVAVLSGIAPGDVVVSAGQMKLRNGTAVAINNAVQPTDEPKPTPPNE